MEVLCPTTTIVVDVTVAVALAHSLRTWASFSSKGNSCSTLNIQCSCMTNKKYRLDSG